jgi:hypothetical protein
MPPDAPRANRTRGQGATQPPSARPRLWLYLPYAVVALLVVGWAGFWFTVKSRVAATLDQAIVREAAAGRNWSCANRSIAGFPFRIEVKCSTLSLAREGDPSAPALVMGPVLAVAQIYSPGHIIAESTGPFTATWANGRKASLVWDAAQVSLKQASGQLERLSLTSDKPVLTLSGFENGDGTSRAQRFESHVRPSPRRAGDAALDLALSFRALEMPALDQLFSSLQPAELKFETSISQSPALAGGVTPVTVEAWRLAGGILDLGLISLTKGTASFEGQGRFEIDEFRRIKGRLDGAQSGIDTLGGVRVSAMLDAGALLSGRPAAQAQGGRNLKPLPPLEARDGRLYLGPLRIPGTPLRPLY